MDNRSWTDLIRYSIRKLILNPTFLVIDSALVATFTLRHTKDKVHGKYVSSLLTLNPHTRHAHLY